MSFSIQTSEGPITQQALRWFVAGYEHTLQECSIDKMVYKNIHKLKKKKKSIVK